MGKMVKVWNNEEEAIKYVEFYSDEKLEYYCLNAMQALEYLHKNNIYYGDMKPENLLIFGNSNVKIGDFGCCIKFPDSSTDDSYFSILGLTKDYSTKEMYASFMNDEEVSKK